MRSASLRSYVRQKEMLTQGQSSIGTFNNMQNVAYRQMNLLSQANVGVRPSPVSTRMENHHKRFLAGEPWTPIVHCPQQTGGIAGMRKRTIAKSLVGNFRVEHMFAIKQAVELYETYQTKIAECELKPLINIWERSRMSLMISRQTRANTSVRGNVCAPASMSARSCSR